jgi:hypothetical protein
MLRILLIGLVLSGSALLAGCERNGSYNPYAYPSYIDEDEYYYNDYDRDHHREHRDRDRDRDRDERHEGEHEHHK